MEMHVGKLWLREAVWFVLRSQPTLLTRLQVQHFFYYAIEAFISSISTQDSVMFNIVICIMSNQSVPYCLLGLQEISSS